MSKIDELKKRMSVITVNVQSIDEEDHSFVAIASTDDEDRHGDVVEQGGWDLKNFKKNPVLLDTHVSWESVKRIIGRVKKIGIEDGKLVFEPKFAVDENPDAKIAWKLYANGFASAFSVGFIPKERDGNKLIENELLEISAVPVPANPNAVALAYDEGTINKDEKDRLIKIFKRNLESLTKMDTVEDNEKVKGESMTEEQEAKLDKALEAIEALPEALKEAVASKDADEETPPAGDEDNGGDDNANDDDSADKSDTGSDGADDADEEVDPENLTEEQAEEIQNAVQAALDKAQGKVE